VPGPGGGNGGVGSSFVFKRRQKRNAQRRAEVLEDDLGLGGERQEPVATDRTYITVRSKVGEKIGGEEFGERGGARSKDRPGKSTGVLVKETRVDKKSSSLERGGTGEDNRWAWAVEVSIERRGNPLKVTG